MNNVSQRQNNIVIFKFEFHKVKQRQNIVLKMIIRKKKIIK